MAVGDIVADLQSKGDDAYLDIKPVSDQWDIHNIFHEDAVELYWSDGTNNLKFATGSGASAFAFLIFEVTSSLYIRVKNIAGAPKLIGYSGKHVK